MRLKFLAPVSPLHPGRSVTIDHQGIPSLNMSAMTMQFRLPQSSSLSLKAGQSIAFTFTASAEGLTIGSVQPVALAAGSGRDRARTLAPSIPGTEGHHMKGMMASCHEMMGADESPASLSQYKSVVQPCRIAATLTT